MGKTMQPMRLGMTRTRLLLAVAVLAWPTVASARDIAPVAVASQPRGADFVGEIASDATRRVAEWVVANSDNRGLPFVIIDKIDAKVFVFDSVGHLRGASFVLLGKARGDESVVGIGSRKLSTIRPEERTTPAGRFVAVLGHDFQQDILWIDYDAALSLHRVVTGNPGDHRLERLATTSTLDKRISYGCINVPVRFYDDVVRKAFTGTRGIVYILPEVRTIQSVLGISDGGDGPTGNAARRGLSSFIEKR